MYFGLPGSGKTTMLVKLAVDASRKKKYKHIYGNITLTGIPRYIQIDPLDLGKYCLEDCLVLIDEATVHFDNREYKNFSKCIRDFIMLHRHYNCDLAFAMQSYNGTEKSIRSVCDRLFMLRKGLFTGWYKSKIWRIPYDIIIPDRKDTGSAHLGEIIEGYCKPNFFARLFTPSLKRAKYYKYFDSWERPLLPDLPAERLDSQTDHNKKSYDNVMQFIQKIPRYRLLKRRKYKIFANNIKKSLTI